MLGPDALAVVAAWVAVHGETALLDLLRPNTTALRARTAQLILVHGEQAFADLLEEFAPLLGADISAFTKLQSRIGAMCIEAGQPFQLLVQIDPSAKNPAGRADAHCYPGRGTIVKPGRQAS